jgi:hypothetical protein
MQRLVATYMPYQLFQMLAVALATESVAVKDGGEGDKKQQKRGNVEISSGAVSGSSGFSLGLGGELDSYGRHGSIDLGSGSIGDGKIGLISGSTGYGKVGLILGNIGHGTTGLSSARGLLSSGVYGLRGYDLGSHLSSGGHKIILLNSRGSGLDGIGVGSGLYGDISGKGSGTGQVPVLVSRPVPLSVPAPYPVPVSVPQAVRVTVLRPYPVPVAVSRPYAVAVPHPVHVQVPQPVTVAVPVPQPVLVSSVSDSGYSGGVGGLGSSAGSGYSTGSSHGLPAPGYSGVIGGLGLSSGAGYTYEASYGSSDLGLGHLSTPLKGVYVPSYLGGLHGSSGGPDSGTSGGSGVYAGSSSARSGLGGYIKN